MAKQKKTQIVRLCENCLEPIAQDIEDVCRFWNQICPPSPPLTPDYFHDIFRRFHLEESLARLELQGDVALARRIRKTLTGLVARYDCLFCEAARYEMARWRIPAPFAIGRKLNATPGKVA